MNSKELLEQAREKAMRITELEQGISTIEELLPEADKGHITINDVGIYDFLDETDAEEIKLFMLNELRHVNRQKISELKQLLGIQSEDKTKVLNPEFIEAVENKVKPPFKADHITCIDGVPKYIDKEPDNSLDKYPAKKKSRKSPYPDNMTPDLVRKMYVDEGKTLKQVAEYFKLKPSQVNGFLIKHKLFRGSYNKSLGQSPPEPLRAQSDTEKCRICGKEIQFSAKMTREMWPYKYKRKQNGIERMMYGCNREHYYAGKTKDA